VRDVRFDVLAARGGVIRTNLIMGFLFLQAAHLSNRLSLSTRGPVLPAFRALNATAAEKATT